MSDLPEGWTITTVGEAGDLSLGRQRSPKYHQGEKMRPYLRVANVFEDRIDTSDVMTMHFSDEEFKRHQLHQGDVLLNEGQSPHLLGRPAIYRGNPPDVAFTNSLIRFRPGPDVIPEWALIVFRHHMRSGRFKREARITTNIAHLSIGRLRSVEFPIPSPDEQRRIVAAIEEQFSRLDVGVTALERARHSIKKLDDLFTLQLLGRHIVLESEWRTLAEVSTHVVDCPHSTPKFSSQGMPCIDTTCISPGVIHYDRLRHVDPSIYEERVRRLVPQNGDVIFAREGTVGTAVVIPADLNPCLGQRVMLFRPAGDEVRGDYLCLMINSMIVKRQYRGRLLGSTVPHLNVRDAKELRIPVPSLSIQEEIAARADEIMSNISFVRNIIKSNVLKSSALQSAILEAAFSGRLI
jgi:restriction endonuclease S subunit